MTTEFNLIGEAEETPRFTVKFQHRGKERALTVREITAADEDAVDRAFPYPPVPKKTLPDGRETLDLANVDWRRACNVVERERRFALVALVSGACGPDAGGLTAAHAKLAARYRREVLEGLYAQIAAATELTETDVEMEADTLSPTGGTPAPSTPTLPSEG